MARGHVLDLRRDIITTEGEVLARVRRVGRLGDRLLQSRGVLVLDDGVREAGLLEEVRRDEARADDAVGDGEAPALVAGSALRPRDLAPLRAPVAADTMTL